MTLTTETTTQQLVDKYLAWLEVRANRSLRTVRSYADTLNQYVDWLDGRPLSSVGVDDVEEFGGRDRRRAKQPSAATIRKDVVAVRLFHRWCSERDLGGARLVSTAIAPKVPQPHPKPLEDEVWDVIWRSDLRPDDRLWLGLGYFAGLRRTEIVTIRPTEVKQAQGLMDFKRKGASYHPLEYVDCLMAVDEELPWLTAGRANQWLDLLHEAASTRSVMGANFLWYDSEGDEERDGNRLNKRLDKRLIPQLNLPPHAVTPHRLRHSCATNLLRAGCLPEFVQAQLAHSSLDITRRYMKMSGQMARWRREQRVLKERVGESRGDA